MAGAALVCDTRNLRAFFADSVVLFLWSWQVIARRLSAIGCGAVMEANPIQQLEEAIFLLRRQDARAWSEYLFGATPLLLGLLKFVHDMSAGYLASRCTFEALLCAPCSFGLQPGRRSLAARCWSL